MKNTAGIAVAGICFALAAHGSVNVFDDAVFWFRGGKDKNGDHCMQKGEFFDDLHADDVNHSNHNMSMTDYTKAYDGFDKNAFRGNATIRNEQVVFPALGNSVVKEMQVLRISNARKRSSEDSPYKYYPFVVNPHSVFVSNNISNEYTIVSRIRMDDNPKRDECLFRIGYDSSERQGMYIAFAKSPASATDNGSRYIKGKCTPNSGSSDTSFNFPVRIPTNTWVDVAVVVGNGKLRIGIATPESSASHDNNSTIAFAETPMWTDNCPLLGDGKYRLFCANGQTAPAEEANADTSCFVGSVQQIAIWGRALSDQDVMAAFGMPRPAIFRTGFDNGSSNEFGGSRSGNTQTIDGLGSWQGVWDEMLAGDTWTNNFNALRDEAGLPQIFSIKSLPTSAPAKIEVELNGTSLGTRRVEGNARVFWPVAANLVVEGANTLTVRRTDGGEGSFLMDAMELGGSLGVGRASHSIDDGRVYPERIATGVPSAADPNPTHWPVGLRPYLNNNTNLHFRVWVDPDVVGVCTSRFWTCANRYASDGHAIEGTEEFSIYVNDTYKISCKAEESWENVSIGFEAGELRGGWNDFEIRSNEAYETCHWLFDRYRFETVLGKGFSIPPPGICIIMR